MSMKYQKIDLKISRRVMKRLRFMSRIWPSHSDIWELRISFSKSQKFDDEVSAAYAERVRFHGNDEDVWVKWAQWEIEGRRNFEKARSILLSKATLYHTDSLILTREYFRLELLYVEHLKKISELKNIEGLEEIALENRSKILSCALPEAIYANACKKFDTPHMYLQFYFVAEKFKFAYKLQKQIYRDALAKYSNEEVVYKLQAKRILSGLSSAPSDEESEDEVVELCPRKKLMGVLEIYDKAVDSIGQTFIKDYVEELLDLLYQCWGVEEYSKIIFEKLFSLFEKFSNVLSSSYFILWYLMALHLKKPNSTLKRILFAAKASFPNCPTIKLHWIKFRHSLKPDLVYNQKNFLDGVSGQIGVKLCMALVNNKATKEAYKDKLFKKAAFHPDATVAKCMRINHIEYLTDDEDAMKHIRALYKEYCYLPPFSVNLHVSMIMKELMCKKVLLNQVRQIFEVAVRQFGHTHIGVWLSFIEFERKFGNNENISNLHQEAQENLDINLFQNFIDLKFYLQNRKAKDSNEEDKFLIGDELQEEDIKEVFWDDSALGSIFVESPILTYSAIAERKNLFLSLAEAVSADKEKGFKKEKEEKGWEKLLTFLLGESISLNVKKVDASDMGIHQDTKEFFEKAEKEFQNKIRRRGDVLSDNLSTSTTPVTSVNCNDVDLEKILKSSATLQPEFLKQKQIIPYYLNIKTQKKIRKIKKAATKGDGWFNMKAPEMDTEVKRDLMVLKMRSALHPDRHYKRNDMKEMPKYFQRGKVIDSPLDFYSNRIPKKERKRTFAEEIINEEQVIRYQKRKYEEIIGKKVQKKRKRTEALKSEQMKSLNKLAKSSTKDKKTKKKKTFKYTRD